MVELWQAWSTEALRQLALDDDVLDIVAQQTVIHVARHGRLVDGKCSQSCLHIQSHHLCVINALRGPVP